MTIIIRILGCLWVLDSKLCGKDTDRYSFKCGNCHAPYYVTGYCEAHARRMKGSCATCRCALP